MLRPLRSIGCPWHKKLLTIPRLMARWNLDPSRARVINPGDAFGDDDKASPISGFRPTPPSAMMLIHPSRPACVQENTFFNARRQENADAIWKRLVEKQAEVFGVQAVETSPSEMEAEPPE